MLSHHQNTIVEVRIKELTLGIWTLLLHATIFFLEEVITIMWNFFFNTAGQRQNSLEINEDGKTPEQKFSGVEFQIYLKDYHTWGCTVFFLEAQQQRGPAGLPKWQPRERTGLYLGHSQFYAGSVALLLNTITGHFPSQYHVVFDKKNL